MHGRESRRKVVTFGSAAIGTALASSVGAAKSSERVDSPESDTRILDQTIISQSKSKSIGGVIIKKDGKIKHYFAIQNKDEKTASVAEADRSTYQSMTTDLTAMSVEAAEEQVSAMGDDDVIERYETWGGTNGSCDAYNYTHQRARISVEIMDDLDELGAMTVLGALGQIIGASSLTGPQSALLSAAATAVIGGAAYFTDEDTFTIGAIEFDKGAFGWTQTFSMPKAGTGFGVSMGNLVPVGGNPGHPGRI